LRTKEGGTMGTPNLHLIKTLRTIEKLILHAMSGKRPKTSDPELALIHDGLLYSYAPPSANGEPRRSLDLNETEFIRVISGAMRELSLQHLPPEVDLSSVRDAVETFKDSYFNKALNSYRTVKDLREAFPYCMSCFQTRALDAAHIVSRGASKRMIDSVDNLMLLCRDCHKFQHDHGLQTFISVYPHLHPRISRAYELFYSGNTEN